MYMRVICYFYVLFFFFFNDTATTEIYTLSLHDALPIFERASAASGSSSPRESTTRGSSTATSSGRARSSSGPRSEEHTSELQSQSNLVCRLLLEKKKLQRKSKTTLLTNIHNPYLYTPIL